MHRHFGLGHLRSSRATETRANSPGLRARLFYSCQRIFECAPYSLGQGHRATAEKVAVRVQFMGPDLVVHEIDLSTYTYSPSAQCEGSK